MVRFCIFWAILLGLSIVLQAAAGNFKWNRAGIRQAIQSDRLLAWKGVSCTYHLQYPIMMVVCHSPDKSNAPKVVDPQKALFEAVSRDDAEGIEAAVHLGADMEAKDSEQMTALGRAAKEGRERAVSTLLRLGAEVEAGAGERGWSPLLWAVAYGQNQTEALLRMAGAKVVDPQKALFEAVSRDDAEGIEAAVHLGADLEETDDEQMTALGLAAKEGRRRAVSTLLKLGAKVEAAAGERGWSPLLWAVANRHNQIEALLRKAGAKVVDPQKALFEAVSRGDAEGIETAVHLGADLEAKNGEQMTALGLAAKEGRERAVSTLLRLGAEVEAGAGERGWSPLLWAVANRHNQIEELLRKAGAQPQKMVDPQKALFEAVSRDDAEGIEAAVHLGADLEAKDGEQMTALGLAAKEGRERAMSTLLSLGAEVNAAAGEKGWSPLLWALANRQNKTEALLRKAGAKVGDLQKVLFEAVGRDDAEGIETAVHLGADLEAKNGEQMTALGLAAKEGRERAVSTLLRLGAEVEAGAGERGWSPLLWAVAYGQNQTEALLRMAGAKVTKKQAQNLLLRGVEEDDVLKIERAIRSGADLEEKRGPWTPLTIASRRGRLEAVRALVRLGAELEGRDGKWLGTALHWASSVGHEALVRLLLQAGAKLEAEDKDMFTPLHDASSAGHLSTVKVLVEAGANINHRTSKGHTPLVVAELRGHPGVAAYLRSVGATT